MISRKAKAINYKYNIFIKLKMSEFTGNLIFLILGIMLGLFLTYAKNFIPKINLSGGTTGKLGTEEDDEWEDEDEDEDDV